MRREVVGFGLLAFVAALGGAAALRGEPPVPEAHAGEPLQGSAANLGCKVRGTAPVTRGAKLFDAPAGGRAIAAFTGAIVPMTMSEIPADPLAGRAKLSTSDGAPALRIDGYVSPSEVQVFTTRDLSVVGEHVWISGAQKVKLVGAAADTLRVELSISGSQGQTIRASAPCDAFALQRGVSERMAVPGNARGYLTRGTTIDLFDRPSGDVIFSLRMLEGTSQLFWSTEGRAGFVHLMSRGDLTIDAWARQRDLEPLKKGEMMDQYIPPTTAVAGAQLALDKPPPLVKASRSIPVRARRDDKETPIGEVEAGAEVYLLETVAGWTNVLPKALGMTPPDEGGFWIPASETPK